MSARALQPLMPFAFGLLVVAPDLLAWVLVLLTILWLASRKYATQATITNQGILPVVMTTLATRGKSSQWEMPPMLMTITIA